MSSTPKRALILGVTGQDGALLSKRLLDDGWIVYGGFRRGSSTKVWRLDSLGIVKSVRLIECQIGELQNVVDVIQHAKPDHIYHLAGESFVADSFKYPGVTLNANVHGVLNVLEAIRILNSEARLVCASSSEIFGHHLTNELIDEATPCRPVNPYGISKLSALHLVRLYREKYGLAAISAIMFNHESLLRGREFVVRKISFNIARLKLAGGDPIELGDLNAARDWGAAQDYVGAMHQMLDANVREDLVVATGQTATVRQCLALAAEAAGYKPVFEGAGLQEICRDALSGKILAAVAERYFRPHDTPAIAGNSERLRMLTGWKGSRALDEIIGSMVAADIDRRRAGIINV